MSLSEVTSDPEQEPAGTTVPASALTPWMSYGLIAVFVAVYALELLAQTRSPAGFSQKIGFEVLYDFGANIPLAFAAGEYWRVFTSCFLHIDMLHLLMNSMALQYFGPLLERSFSPWRLLLAFVLTGMGGSLASTLMHINTPFLSAGASGGLYGLFGVIFVAGKRYKAAMPASFQTWLNQTMGMLVIFSFIPGIDMWGHFGGLATGCVLGLFYRPRRQLHLETPGDESDLVDEDEPEASERPARPQA